MVYFEIKEASSLALCVDGASQRPKAKRKNKDMGYQMPIVCKEIYLPVDANFLTNNPTVEEYNERYGLDLLSIVKPVYDADNSALFVKERPYTKIYLMIRNYGAGSINCVRMANSPLYLSPDSPTFDCSYMFTDVDKSDFGVGIKFSFKNGVITNLGVAEI